MRATATPCAFLLLLVGIPSEFGFGAAAKQSTPRKLPTADTVLTNGRILTMDPADTIAEGVAIADGKILAVGSSATIHPLIGKSTRVVDLRGRAATPGLIDTHAHLDSLARLKVWINLTDPSVRSIADVQRLVKERAAALKPGAWVLGKGWDEGRLAERRHILASDLDAVAAQHPVYLEHVGPRVAVVNSVALKLAGIDKASPDPPAGAIDRLANGTPNGVLRQTALGRVRPLLPQLTPEERRTGLLEVVSEFHREGMTAAKLPLIDQAGWERLEHLLKAGELTVRVFALWRVGVGDASPSLDDADALIARVSAFTKPYLSNDGRLISGGVKLLVDGSWGARTAWMYEDYSRDFTGREEGNQGELLIPSDTYRALVRRFHAAGMHVATHAIGDRAIDLVVETYADALKANPTRGMRHSIIHAVLPSDRAIAAIADLQTTYDAGYPEAQAAFMWWTGDTLARNIGPLRSRRVMPFKTYVERGILWAGGSDAAVTPFPARHGIWASVARATLQGTHGLHPFGTTESVSVRHALRSYTTWAARQLFLEDRIGSIEVGKEADIAVWDRDPYSVSPAALKDMRCEMTLFRGKTVYEAPVGRVADRNMP